MEDTKMDGKSLDITKMNIEALKELFPDVVEEDRIDFDKLRAILGEEVDNSDERYNFTWYGKNQAIRISQTPSMGTLRPCKEKSVNWDDTKNIYIEGDNLEVLKLLQKSYFGKVKMIYIDPPYNTGKDFVYPDDYKDNVYNYLSITGQIDSEGNKNVTNTDSEGRFHTKWLNMMYPRLKLARSFLSRDGIIFISIDDYEVSNLRKICDEIFGENNFLGELPTIMNLKGNNSQFCFAGAHEYTLVYCKNHSLFIPGLLTDVDEDESSWLTDDKGYYKKGATLKRTGKDAPREKRPYGYYPILVKDKVINTITLDEFSKIYNEDTKEFDDEWVESLSKKYSLLGFDVILPSNGSKKTSWRWSIEKVKSESDDIIVLDKNTLYKKQRPELGDMLTRKPKTVLYKSEYSSGNGTAEVSSLFDGKSVFDNPKPLTLIKDLIAIGTHGSSDYKSALIMDFFSGSATLAQAVMDLNREDSGNRSYILVQLPEEITSSSNPDAYEILSKLNKPQNICEIAIERISRARNRIVGSKETLNHFIDQDTGLRVFKLDTSNIKIWNGNVDNIQKTISSFENNLLIESNRNEEDLLFELIIKMGLPLSVKIDSLEIDSGVLYSIGYGALMVYLGDVNTTKVAEDIIALYRKEEPEIWKVVFRDNGFSSDSVKANIRETLKAAGLAEDSFITL